MFDRHTHTHTHTPLFTAKWGHKFKTLCVCVCVCGKKESMHVWLWHIYEDTRLLFILSIEWARMKIHATADVCTVVYNLQMWTFKSLNIIKPGSTMRVNTMNMIIIALFSIKGNWYVITRLVRCNLHFPHHIMSHFTNYAFPGIMPSIFDQI